MCYSVVPSVFSLLGDRLAGNFLWIINRRSEPVKVYSPLFALVQLLGAIILLSSVLNLRVLRTLHGGSTGFVSVLPNLTSSFS